MDRETLRKAYLEEKMSTWAIAERYNLSQTRVYRLLIKFGIPVRGKAEATQVAIEKDRHSNPNPIGGAPKPPEAREEASKSALQYWEDQTEKQRKQRLAKARQERARRLFKEELIRLGRGFLENEFVSTGLCPSFVLGGESDRKVAVLVGTEEEKKLRKPLEENGWEVYTLDENSLSGGNSVLDLTRRIVRGSDKESG